MPASTIAVLATIVAVFAAFAVGLAWAQLHARSLASAADTANRPRRRPF